MSETSLSAPIPFGLCRNDICSGPATETFSTFSDIDVSVYGRRRGTEPDVFVRVRATRFVSRTFSVDTVWKRLFLDARVSSRERSPFCAHTRSVRLGMPTRSRPHADGSAASGVRRFSTFCTFAYPFGLSPPLLYLPPTMSVCRVFSAYKYAVPPTLLSCEILIISVLHTNNNNNNSLHL